MKTIPEPYTYFIGAIMIGILAGAIFHVGLGTRIIDRAIAANYRVREKAVSTLSSWVGGGQREDSYTDRAMSIFSFIFFFNSIAVSVTIWVPILLIRIKAMASLWWLKYIPRGVLIINGYIVGFLTLGDPAYWSMGGFKYLGNNLLPHGIIEIPMICIAASISFWLVESWVKRYIDRLGDSEKMFYGDILSSSLFKMLYALVAVMLWCAAVIETLIII